MIVSGEQLKVDKVMVGVEISGIATIGGILWSP